MVWSRKALKLANSCENRDEFKSGAKFPSKRENYDGIYQRTLLYKIYLQNITIFPLFFFKDRDLRIRGLARVSFIKLVSSTVLLKKMFQSNFLRRCAIGSSKDSISPVIMISLLVELLCKM